MVGAADVLLVHGCQHAVLHVEVVDGAVAGAGQRQRVGQPGSRAAVRTGCILLNETRAVALTARQRWTGGEQHVHVNQKRLYTDVHLYIKRYSSRLNENGSRDLKSQNY